MTTEQASGCCTLCERAAERGGLWLELGWVCAECQSGALDAALQRHGLAVADEPVSKDRRLWQVRVRHPTPLAAAARLSLERLGHKARKLFGKGDPEVGDARFDDRVWVEADDAALPLLEQPAVHGAIVELLQVPLVTGVELDGDALTVQLTALGDVPAGLIDSVLASPRERARRLAVALAVQLERWARQPAR